MLTDAPPFGAVVLETSLSQVQLPSQVIERSCQFPQLGNCKFLPQYLATNFYFLEEIFSRN
jgi:hypothetical protein